MDAFMISETTAGRRPPAVIRVCDVVPVELRLIAVIEVRIRHVVGRLVPGAGLLLIPIHSHRRLSFTAKGLYALSPEFNLAAGEIGIPSTRTRNQQVVSKTHCALGATVIASTLASLLSFKISAILNRDPEYSSLLSVLV